MLSAVGNPDARAPGKKKRGGRGAKGGEKLTGSWLEALPLPRLFEPL